MDPNDPRQRLRVLNQSSPSLRVATAPPQPQPQISLNTTLARTPNLYVPGSSQPIQQSSSVYSAPPQQPQQSPWGGFLHTVGNIGKSVVHPFAEFGDAALHVPQAVYREVQNKPINDIQQNVFGTTDSGKIAKKIIGDTAQVGLTFMAPGAGAADTLSTRAAVDAGIGAGLGGADAFSRDESLPSIAKNAAIGGALGGVFAPVSKVAGRVLQPVTDRFGDIAKKIAKETSSEAITRRFGIPEEAASFLSKESNPKTVRAVMDQMSANASDVPMPDRVGSPTSATDALGTNNVAQPPAATLNDGDFASAIDEAKKAAGVVDDTPAYQRGFGQVPNLASTPSAPNAAKDAYQAEQSALRAANSTEAQTYAAGLDPGNPADNVPAFMRGGRILPSDSAAADRIAVLNKQLEVMPSEENVRTVVYNLKKQYAEAVQKNPAVKDVLRKHFDEQVQSIEGTLNDRAKIEAEVGRLSQEQAKTAGLTAKGKESLPTPKETQAIEPTLIQDGNSDAMSTSPRAPAAKVDMPVEASPMAPETPAERIGRPAPANADNTAKEIPSTSPNVQAAAQQVMDSLHGANISYNVANKARSAEKAARANSAKGAYESAGGGAEGVRAKLGALKGKYTESNFSPIDASPETKKALLDNIEKSGMKEFEKLNTQVALSKVFGDVAGKPTPYDIRLLREHFGEDFAQAVQDHVEAQGTGIREKLAALASTPKAAMATADLSAPLRQGAVLGSRFPKQMAENAAQSVKYFSSQKAYDTAMYDITQRPTYELMKKAKLAVDGAEGIVGTEEQFMSSLLETKTAKHLGIGHIAAASDRGYTGFLTKFRADVFDKILTDTKNAGVELDNEALQSLGKFINSASGRGDLGSLERHAGLLSKALFSPRLWKSRLDLLNPVYYAKLSPIARKYALQSSAAFAGTAGTILALAAAAGATVIWDPRSADFAKIKVGNTRYDILGGLQQNIRLGAQLISGQKINSSTGELQTLGDGITTPSRKDLLYQFFENKENPLVGYASKVLAGKDAGGNPINPATEAGKLFVPLNVAGAVDTAKDTGSVAKGIAMNLPGEFGVGVQTYGNTPSNNQGTDANGQPVYKGKIAPNMVTDKSGQVILDSKGKPVTVKFPKDATDLEKQALLDEKRTSAMATQYKDKLSSEDQALLKLSPKQLQAYKDGGQITPEQYDRVEQQQQDIKNLDGIEIPEGLKSSEAKAFYENYNSLTKAAQKAYLTAPADDNAKTIAAELNKQRSAGLSEYKPSNALAKAYADYENDINTHPEYTEIDKRNKAKSFQTSATKLNYNQNAQDIYAEGGSSDLKTLMAGGHIDKGDLDAAVKMDNELYASGLTGSLKFSKKFREGLGYGVPANPDGSSSGGSRSAQLSLLIPSLKTGGPPPKFSAKTRPAPTGVKFKPPTGVIPQGGSDRIMIAPYRTKTLTKLRNSVSG